MGKRQHKQMTNTQKTISFDQELWSKIDKQKGDISRSRFVAKIITERLVSCKNEKKNS